MNKNMNLFFVLLLSIGLCSCKKEDYYELEDGLYNIYDFENKFNIIRI